MVSRTKKWEFTKCIETYLIVRWFNWTLIQKRYYSNSFLNLYMHVYKILNTRNLLYIMISRIYGIRKWIPNFSAGWRGGGKQLIIIRNKQWQSSKIICPFYTKLYTYNYYDWRLKFILLIWFFAILTTKPILLIKKNGSSIFMLN
jgi:hypothetical protein